MMSLAARAAPRHHSSALVLVSRLGLCTEGRAALSSAAMLLARIVIVGAGQAAAAAIDTLRRRGYAGAIALVGEEDSWPYQRPPLSKKYLAGALAHERLLIRPAHFYAEHAIQTHLSRRVTDIDRIAQRIRLDDATTLAYDELLLATGSRPRVLSAPGADALGVHYLRTVKD